MPTETDRQPATQAAGPCSALLSRHRDLETFLRRDQVILIVFLEVDLHPVHLAAELVAPRSIVGGDGRPALLADVAGLVRRERHRDGLLDPALADRFTVHVERDVAAFG